MTYVHANQLFDIKEKSPTYVAIGSFDGVHLGHQQVLRSMVASAAENGAKSAVLTFFPHPKRVLQGLQGRYYLSTVTERVQQLAELGVDLIITQPFNEQVQHTRAADYVDQLCHHLNMKQLWGGNFSLGYKREGDVAMLRRLGQEKGYTVQLADAMVSWRGELVSSSRVRRSLRAGDMADVAGCLGRPYHVSGPVVKGDQRGRTIGFPTANIEAWSEQMLPANGVYAVYAWLGERRFLAAANVGERPTVNGSGVSVEAHLLDFAGDLYGQQIQLAFIQRLRPEHKFSSLDALKTQIALDVAEARAILSAEG